jgi:hypothetical protein
VVVYITQPLVVKTRIKTAAQESPRDKLLAERDALYTTIRDLDLDFQTGKLVEADYRVMREKYTARGVEILQELDALPHLGQLQARGRKPEVGNEIEAAVQARRQAKARPAQAASEDNIEAAIRAKRKSRIGDQPSAVGGHVCPSCGTPCDPADRFCAKCGTALTMEATR